MSATKAEIGARLPVRRGLGESEAALYVGLSSSKFRAMVEQGDMPRPRLVGRRRIWDIDDLDAAFRSLTLEGETSDQWSDVA